MNLLPYCKKPDNISLSLGILIVWAMLDLEKYECCEFQAFKEHLDFHHLKHAVILQQRQSRVTTNSRRCGGRQAVTWEKDLFGRNLLNQNMRDYFFQFFNLDDQTNNNKNKKDLEQLFRNISPRVGLFLTYTKEDIAKRNIFIWASENGWFNYSVSWFVFFEMEDNGDHLANIHQTFGNLNVQLNADVTVAFKRVNR